MRNPKKDPLDWPGWPLDQNPYGKDFDQEARIRMIAGSEELLPVLKKYIHQADKCILEIGPFFNPLVTPARFSEKIICYWENDRHVLEWLAQRNPNVHAIYCDLNAIRGESLLKIRRETQKELEKEGIRETRFDAIVLSHVLNYVDYKLLLAVLPEFLQKNGQVFINHVTDYGLPAFFSVNRPKNVQEILQTLQETGYWVKEKNLLSPRFPPYQKNKRLILVAQKE
ncbi:MAG: hypothetical protein HY917_01980 [Candidatus Diapherotrites archaeon]|nr:hypothetical protein [Candidatus Diapherotrites archaeon]